MAAVHINKSVMLTYLYSTYIVVKMTLFRR